jgi:hypothetical protein
MRILRNGAASLIASLAIVLLLTVACFLKSPLIEPAKDYSCPWPDKTGAPPSSATCRVRRERGILEKTWTRIVRTNNGPCLETLYEQRIGWPFYAMMRRAHRLTPAGDRDGPIVAERPTSWRDGVLIVRNGQELIIPVVPVPSGLVGNTGIVWVFTMSMIYAIWITRRRWRRRHGRCAACGYHVGQQQKCSECGATLAANLDAVG